MSVRVSVRVCAYVCVCLYVCLCACVGRCRYIHPVPVHGLRVSFSLRLSNYNATQPFGVEGVVLHLQNDALDAGGGIGGRLNYDNNIAADFAIEVDCLRSSGYDDGAPLI
jgi:hypothetical protein